MSVTPLRKLHRPKPLHHSVQESVKAFITDNRLAPGDPLAPEGELAASLGVSRSSVREAIRALESIGIVESRRGVGVFVSAFSFAPLLDNLAFGLRHTLRELEEMLEVRRALEVGMIGDAMCAMTANDLRELQAVCTAMGRRAEQGEPFAAEDQAFHLLLFRSQGNATLARLLDVFWLAFSKAAAAFQLHDRTPAATWRDHQAIVDALRTGDADAVRARLREHYDGIMRLIETRRPPRPTKWETT